MKGAALRDHRCSLEPSLDETFARENANLRATNAELLAALKALLDSRQYASSHLQKPAVELARTAITRAEQTAPAEERKR